MGDPKTAQQHNAQLTGAAEAVPDGRVEVLLQGALNTAADRCISAVSIAEEYGSIDGSHHKMWVIDQMVRALLGPELYVEWRSQHPEWEEGTVP